MGLTTDRAQHDDFVKEWDKARDACARFDDLIMKIRTFGLPLIATVVGAGSAFGTKGPRLDVPWEATFGLIVGIGLFFALSLAYVVSRTRAHAPSRALGLGAIEMFSLWLIPACFGGWAVGIALKTPDSLLFPSPILTLGGLLLFLIYLLDRFYYTALLLGAVGRARALEEQLNFKLSDAITEIAPPWTYTLLPAAMYVVPVLILVNLGLAAATFSGSGP